MDSVKIVRSGSNNELTVNSLSSTRATASTVDEIVSVTNSMLKEKGLLGSDVSSWPNVLRDIAQTDNAVSKSILCALGAMVMYLKRCKVAADTISQRRIQWCTHSHTIPTVPSTMTTTTTTTTTTTEKKTTTPPMTLDGNALRTLEVLRNEHNGSLEGSLLSFVNICRTPFGKLEMRRWITNPLTDVKEIEKRLDAVDSLRENTSVVSSARDSLGNMPNLESALSRICAMAGIHRKKADVNDKNFHHPDTRAIFYEGKTYSIRKVSAFLKLLGGLELSAGIVSDINRDMDKKVVESSSILSDLLSIPVNEILDTVKSFRNSFDMKVAMKSGTIVPKPGVNQEYVFLKFYISLSNILKPQLYIQQV